MEFRDYQEQCFETISNVNVGTKNLVMLPTGSGKTIVLSMVAATAKGRVLIAVPSTELREQTEEKLRMINVDLDIGHVQGALNQTDSKIIIATRQSLTHSKSNRLKQMLSSGEFEYLIIDESHQAPHQIIKVIEGINNNVKIVGFSATPYNKESKVIFGEPIFKRTILDMIDKEYLVEPFAILVKSKTNISHVKTMSGDFNKGDLERTVNNNDRNQLIVESYKKYAADRILTLVFAAGCDHGKQLLALFREEDIAVEYLDGETPVEKRKEIISRYKNKEVKVLINIMTLTTGFDVPETDTIMVCRPSKSRILYEQIIGRGLRLAPNKKDCMIIDIEDITKRHDLMNVSDVFSTPMRHGETLKEARKRVIEEQIELERCKEEERRIRIEREQKRKEALEIEAQRVRLINKDLKRGFEDRKYDWFRVGASAYALASGITQYYVVESYNDKFRVYDAQTDRDKKSIVQLIEFDLIMDAIIWTEKTARLNTYSDPKSPWKKDPPTEAQLGFCPWAKSKWEVNTYFSSKSLSNLLSKAAHQKNA